MIQLFGQENIQSPVVLDRPITKITWESGTEDLSSLDLQSKYSGLEDSKNLFFCLTNVTIQQARAIYPFQFVGCIQPCYAVDRPRITCQLSHVIGKKQAVLQFIDYAKYGNLKEVDIYVTSPAGCQKQSDKYELYNCRLLTNKIIIGADQNGIIQSSGGIRISAQHYKHIS